MSFVRIILINFVTFHCALGGFLFPDNPDHVNLNVYIIFTPSLYESYIYRVDYLERLYESSNFNVDRPTVIYIPGFKNTGVQDYSVTAIRSAYRERRDHNVIVVDWSYYAQNTLYGTLIPQLRIICETIAVNLMKFLDKGYDVEKLHLVGHSLGAQCIGLIGRHLRSISGGRYEIPRLYGLDPAGPSFETVDWMTFFGGSFDSISYFDAKYVQLIHSNAGFYGITESRGHVDFFPNGGKEQGGCENNAMANSCYHSRSWQMYQESVRNPNTFLAQKCDSYEQFKKEACHNEQAFMGHSLNVSARGNFFLRTHRNVYRMSVGSSGVHYRKTKVCKDDICIYQEEFMD